MKNPLVSKTAVGRAIDDRIQELGLTYRDVAIQLGASYEHIRKIVRGHAVPSKFLLPAIANKLHLDNGDLERMANGDNIRRKYGQLPGDMTGQKAGMDKVCEAWDDLTAEQKRDLSQMAANLAKRNKRTYS